MTHSTDTLAEPAPPGGGAPDDAGSAAPLEVLNQIARIATLDLELRPMLQRIVDALREAFGWEFVACFTVDPARGTLVYEAVSSDQPVPFRTGAREPLEHGAAGEVARTGRAVLLDDLREHEGLAGTLEATRAELCVPVRHGGRTVAILDAESRHPGAFRGQLALLETVAEQVAGAIASARLFTEVRHRARLLEMVGEISRAALEAGEMEPLLESVVHYLHRHFPRITAAIHMVDPERGYTETARAGLPRVHVAGGTWWPLSEGVVGRSIRTGEPQLVMDVNADPDYIAVHDAVVAELAVPIVFRGRTLGALGLESTGAEVFTAENVAAFRTFADQLAGAIHLAAMNRELERANEQLREVNHRLERLSLTDALTEIANRRHFGGVLEQEWRRAQRAGLPLSLVMLDLDHFKAYNDAYGHPAGDRCLHTVAQTLRDSLRRAGDLAARYGGEEFVLLLPETDAHGVAQFAERLRTVVEELGIVHEHSPVAPCVTASLGVATVFPRDGVTPEMLVEEADRALYRAKHDGRNRVRQCIWVAPGHSAPITMPIPEPAPPNPTS